MGSQMFCEHGRRQPDLCPHCNRLTDSDYAIEARMDRIHVAERAVIEAARDVAQKGYLTEDFLDAVRALDAAEKEET